MDTMSETNMTTITEDDLRAACRAYLEDKHCTLWGDFDIQNAKRLDDAVTWLSSQIIGVSAYCSEEMLRK